MDIALLYRCKVRSASNLAMQAGSLAEFHAQTREFAVRNGISGFHLNANGCCYHVLEGDFATVTSLFSRVLGDGQFTDIELISSAPITSREFQEWSAASVASFSRNHAPSVLLKINLLHDYTERFGKPKPVLRDILARIAGEMAADRLPRGNQVVHLPAWGLAGGQLMPQVAAG